MDEENQINDKLKIMKFSLLPCGLKHTPFFMNVWQNALVVMEPELLLLYNDMSSHRSALLIKLWHESMSSLAVITGPAENILSIWQAWLMYCVRSNPLLQQSSCESSPNPFLRYAHWGATHKKRHWSNLGRHDSCPSWDPSPCCDEARAKEFLTFSWDVHIVELRTWSATVVVQEGMTHVLSEIEPLAARKLVRKQS